MGYTVSVGGLNVVHSCTRQ